MVDNEIVKSSDFEVGRLHGRLSTLEVRVDRQETLLTGIDGKIDEIGLSLARAVGGKERAAAIAKAVSWTVGILASLGAAVGWASKYFTLGMHG